MTAFVSKVQYRICEDGEYYEERERTLPETLALINSFHWHREVYEDISLTGTSITITDQDNNYLKIGIHYGSRFHLYYLDKAGRLYERYPINIDDVEDTVTDLFTGRLNLQALEKQPHSLFYRSRYFITKNFDYKVNPWQSFRHTSMICFGAAAFLFLFIFVLFTEPALTGSEIFMILPIIAFVSVPLYCFVRMRAYRGQHLHISRANDEFIFGNSAGEVFVYNKADVVKIIITVSSNTKKPVDIDIVEIFFKDYSSIKFPGLLISAGELKTKFTAQFEPEWVTVEKWILSEL